MSPTCGVFKGPEMALNEVAAVASRRKPRKLGRRIFANGRWGGSELTLKFGPTVQKRDDILQVVADVRVRRPAVAEGLELGG